MPENIFSIKVIPGSSCDQMVGREGEYIKIKLKAPPVDGKANEALIKFLAEFFQVKKSAIEIIRGTTSRKKTVKIVSTKKINI